MLLIKVVSVEKKEKGLHTDNQRGCFISPDAGISEFYCGYTSDYNYPFHRDQDIRHINTAVRLNKVMKERSSDSQLVIVNLPCVPTSYKGQERCIL